MIVNEAVYFSLLIFLILFDPLEIATEKLHQSLFQMVENFDKTSMKQTEVTEKNPLPANEGSLIVCSEFSFWFIILFWFIIKF